MCYDSLVALIEPKWRVARVFIGLPDDTVVPTKESSSRVATLMLLISIDFLFLHLVTVFSPSWTWYFSISALVFLAIGSVQFFPQYNENLLPVGVRILLFRQLTQC